MADHSGGKLRHSRYDYGDEEIGPIIFTSGSFLPPKYERRRFFGQEWSEWSGHAQTYGALAKFERGAWRAALGIFNSRFTQDEYAASFFLDTDREGMGNRRVIAGADQRFASTSGEAKLSRDFTEGDRLHRVIASIRARRVADRFGGFDAADLGPGVVGVSDPEPEPDFSFGELTRDRVNQETGSLGYELRWSGVGEFNVGVQKTRYAKTVLQPGLPAQTRTDSPWLWNAGIALTMIDDLAIYAATTRGLEESGTAPSSAVNANEPLPALRTKQAEVGLRYRFANDMRVIVGLFDVQKPYFEIDQADGVFRVLGEVRHKGAEISLSGKPVEGLNVVAGAVLLRPRVTGDAVEDGRLGSRPLGRTGTLLDLRLDYRFPRFDALSIDLGMNYTGRRVARTDNTLYVPERLTVDVGGRYRFKIGEAPATFRIQVRNLTNNYSWLVLGGGAYQPTFSRSLVASIAADF
ncbi:TonB-dependent receptor [Leptolyngbya sp. 15MV]|nr:TonB-dependent receptor [Leptolyngbya sp. 15MV]